MQLLYNDLYSIRANEDILDEKQNKKERKTPLFKLNDRMMGIKFERRSKGIFGCYKIIFYIH